MSFQLAGNNFKVFQFVLILSEISATFFDLDLKIVQTFEMNVRFQWIQAMQQEFLDIKSMLASRPVLVPPDYSKLFI